MRAYFYDTWAFLALANAHDAHHAACSAADAELERRRWVAVTSDYVLDETLTGLHAAAGASVALRLLELLDARIAAQELLLLEVESARRSAAIALFRKLAPDEPRLSFTDCTSFALMRELGIAVAFTADRHFHRAGKDIRPLFERRGGTVIARLPDG